MWLTSTHQSPGRKWEFTNFKHNCKRYFEVCLNSHCQITNNFSQNTMKSFILACAYPPSCHCNIVLLIVLSRFHWSVHTRCFSMASWTKYRIRSSIGVQSKLASHRTSLWLLHGIVHILWMKKQKKKKEQITKSFELFWNILLDKSSKLGKALGSSKKNFTSLSSEIFSWKYKFYEQVQN